MHFRALCVTLYIEVRLMSNGRIAVLIPSVYDELDKELISGIQTASTEIGYDTLIFTGVSTENVDGYTQGENNIYKLPFVSEVDGIILAANRFSNNELKISVIKQIEKSGIPCVAIEEETDHIKGVFLDQGKVIYDITTHLIAYHGYRDILCLTGPNGNSEAEKRAEGYMQAVKEFGISAKVIYGDFWRNAPTELAQNIVSGKYLKPEAIVCTSDVMAVTLCQVFTENGIKVPDDVAVTGYDGSIYTAMTKPAITTAFGGDKCLGKLAVKEIAEQLGIKCSFDCGEIAIRFCGSCGCENVNEERNILLDYTEKMVRTRLGRKSLMFSNYIAKMSDCGDIPKFAAVLDSLRHLLYDCRSVNVCLCDDWRKEHPEYRKSGFSENMNLIYSEEQPGQLAFPVKKLLPSLSIPHEPQFWVFSSLHYTDKIMGYIATCYDSAEHFTADEHYTGWCDAVANGLDIVIKKSNTEYIWQKLEEKNKTDLYTGLLSKRGFALKATENDKLMLISFPERYKEMQYFVSIVSAVLRSDDSGKIALYLGGTLFGVSIKNNIYKDFMEKFCRSLSELGIYITENDLEIIAENIDDNCDIERKLTEMMNLLSDKNTSRRSEVYSVFFSELRKSMKYTPQDNWNVLIASEKAGLSASHFQRLYKKYFGVSFNEELIRFRLDRAKYLLKNTSMSVQRVAEECGYTSAAHFMRQFKDREKVSAGKYRKG